LALPRLWLTLAALATLGVGYLSLMPSPPRPPGALSWDKAQHVLAYVVLAALWFQATRGRRWPLTLMLVLTIGLALELIQGFVGLRQLQPMDMLANGIGVACGGAMSLTPLGHVLMVIDRGLARVVPGSRGG